jgi:SEC-C motif domain protein
VDGIADEDFGEEFDEEEIDDEDYYPETYVRPAPKVRRNEPCPCGSGKKYKRCCGAA